MTEIAALHVYLAYRDAPAAIDWLERALGFTTTMRYDDERGVVVHAELRRGESALVVFADDGAGYDRPGARGDTVGQGVYFAVTDPAVVDATWAQAIAAGAVPVWEPASTQWGNYRCRVRDAEGYEWTFGTHRPGQDVAAG